jgi:hypothetical protein
LRKTGSAIAAGTRSIVPPAFAVLLLAAGGVGLGFFGVLADSEPELGREAAGAVILGFRLLAVPIVWVGAVPPLALLFLGRHVGRLRNDPTD